jgi:hypothetical protein
MAIKIPVRSSASESVGGKAMRIPRGKLPAVNLRTDTNLLGVAASSSSPESINKLTSFLDTTTQRIKAHNDKLRQQEIKNFNTKNLSLLTKELQDYNFAIEDNRDADTSLIWGNFTTFYDKTLKRYKDTVYKGKEEEWERFVSHFHAAFNAGKSDLRLIRNTKIKGNARVSFNFSLDKFKTDVSKLPTSQTLVDATKLLLKEFNAEQNHYAQIDNTLVFDAETYAYKSMYQKIASADHKFMNKYDGVEYLNFQDIYQELRQNKTYGTFGKIPETYRTELIKWADKGITDQKDFFINQQIRLNDVNGDLISKLIGDWINDDLKPKDAAGNDISSRTYLESMIQKAESTHKITPEFAKGLYTRIKTVANDKASGKTGDIDSYGSVSQVDKYFKEIILGQSNGQEWLLTLQEDDLISYKGKEWLLDKRDKWTTKMNERSKEVVKGYLDKYDGNIDRLTKAALESYQDYPQYARIFDSQKQQIRNTLFLLLNEGEEAGISYYSMMEDINSEHYIPFKLDKIYAESYSSIVNKITTDQDFTIENYWKSKQADALSYFIDADAGTAGQQVYSAYDSVVTGHPAYGFEMEQVPAEGAKVAVFYKRWLAMPRPPSMNRADGSKIPIGEYETSKEWKKYERDWLIWYDKGNWNSADIPSKYKIGLGFEDLSNISEK